MGYNLNHNQMAVSITMIRKMHLSRKNVKAAPQMMIIPPAMGKSRTIVGVAALAHHQVLNL